MKQKIIVFCVITLLFSSCKLPGNTTPTSTPLVETPITVATNTSSITERLISLSPDEFTPSLNTLDQFVQSILVTNP